MVSDRETAAGAQGITLPPPLLSTRRLIPPSNIFVNISAVSLPAVNVKGVVSTMSCSNDIRVGMPLRGLPDLLVHHGSMIGYHPALVGTRLLEGCLQSGQTGCQSIQGTKFKK